MVLVLDTNVYISAMGKLQSYPGEIERAWREGQIVVAVSEPILAELEATFAKDKLREWLQLSLPEIQAYISDLRQAALVTPGKVTATASPDPDDNKFLACAVEARADAIVTGDQRHLLALQTYQGIPIVTPRQCVERLLQRRAA